MNVRFALALACLIASACAGTSPARKATPAAPPPAPVENKGGQGSGEAEGTHPQTEEEKTIYALGLSIGRTPAVSILSPEELEFLKAGLYAQVKGEKPEVELEQDDLMLQGLKKVYAQGVNIGRTLSVFDLSPEELDFLRAGLDAQLKGEKPEVEVEQYGPKIQGLAAKRQQVSAAREKERSMAYLERAAHEPGAVVTESGLVYQELMKGTGASPKAKDVIRVQYQGTLIDGQEFDSSHKRGEPATFPLDGVIRCWAEGMQKMSEGGKARLVCPSSVAYGDRGAPPDIKGGATLIFEVELLEVIPAREAEYASMIQQAKGHVATGQYEASVGSYRAALSIKKDSLEAKEGLGFSLIMMSSPSVSDYLEAVRLLQSVVSKTPKNARVWFALGMALQVLQRDAKAVQAYQRYLKLEPSGKFASDAREALRQLKRR